MALEARLDEVEAAPRKRFLWIFNDWQEALKVVALPLTFIYGGLKFYDDVWTRWDREQAAAAAAAQDSLRELQAMNAEIYRLNSNGEGEEAFAFIEANRGRKARLVAEAVQLWQGQPDYYMPHEAQMLANELLESGRTDLALEIMESLEPAAVTAIERADLELMKGRITGADGPAFDLDAMRGHMRGALREAEAVRHGGQRNKLQTKIAQMWLYYELWHDTGCDTARPVTESVQELALPEGAPGFDAVDAMAAERIAIFRDRCGDL